MRLRNVKGGHDKISAHHKTIHHPQQHKGGWKAFFGNENPIHLEIGMGKGQFLLEHARQNPDINYIGFEKFTAVLVKALAKWDEEDAPDNIFVVRLDVDNILDVFQPSEVDRIYLNFSDPWPKERHSKRRLTSRQFLEKYKVILKSGGDIIFKTDNVLLFHFSIEQIKEFGLEILAYTEDLHNSAYLEGNIMTEYESKFVGLGMPIHMVHFKMPEKLTEGADEKI